MDLKESDAIGGEIDNHWYYISKLRLIERYIPPGGGRLLDIGAGVGWFSRKLLERERAHEAICIDPGYIADYVEQVNGRSLSFRRTPDGASADVILLMDVLEHVEDDLALLSSYVEQAAPGTHFLITVPAFEALWSAHDDFLGHHRRYTLSRLRSLIRNAGLAEVQGHYHFASILPVAVIVRLLRRNASPDHSDMRPVPRWVGIVLKTVLGFELRWTKFNRLAGLTIVCHCRK